MEEVVFIHWLLSPLGSTLVLPGLTMGENNRVGSDEYSMLGGRVILAQKTGTMGR